MAADSLPNAKPAFVPPLVWAVGSGMLGIVIDRYLGCSVPCWLILASTAWLMWLMMWLLRRNRLSAAALCIAFLAVAGAWHHWHWSLFEYNELGEWASFQGRPVVLEAVAQERPRLIPAPPFDPLSSTQTEDRSRLQVEVLRIRNAGIWHEAAGIATLTIAAVREDIRAGYRLRIYGEIGQYEPPRNPGERDFRAYAQARRKRAWIWCDQADGVKVIAQENPWPWWRRLDELRSWCREQLRTRLAPQQFGIGSALLLGGYENISPEQRDTFLQTGTMHVLAISGLHVGMAAAALFVALYCGWLPRRFALVAIGLFVLAYCLLTEGRAPVVRATILVLMVCGAELLWRRSSWHNALAAAALIILTANPCDLFQLGPQLSFLAVGTLAIAGRSLVQREELDPLQQLVAESRPWPLRWLIELWRWFYRSIGLSGAVWLVTLPLVMRSFHLASPVAILLNLLLWIPLAGALVCGLGVLITAAWLPSLADACGVSCNYFLTCLEALVDWGHSLPANHFWVPGPQLWWVLGFYGLLGSWLCLREWFQFRWLVTLLVVWTALGLGWTQEQPRELRCTFLSVGNGEAIVVELPDGKTLLYDIGQFGAPRLATERVSGYLWERNLTHIDAVILSHADLDHFNGLPGLLERFSIGVIYLSPTFADKEEKTMRQVLEYIKDSHVPLRELSQGDTLLAGEEVPLSILHPPPGGVYGSDNANSLVLEIQYQGRTILLTGDVEEAGIAALTTQPTEPIDILLAPHHGSYQSDPPAMASWAQPEVVILSRGYRPGYASTVKTYQEAGAKIYATSADGAITVRIRSEQMSVETFW